MKAKGFKSEFLYLWNSSFWNIHAILIIKTYETDKYSRVGVEIIAKIIKVKTAGIQLGTW